MERNPLVGWNKVDDMSYGCANQAGEDNRNVGRMAALLAGLAASDSVPANTVNRLCGSGMDAIGPVAHAIKMGKADPAGYVRRAADYDGYVRAGRTPCAVCALHHVHWCRSGHCDGDRAGAVRHSRLAKS